MIALWHPHVKESPLQGLTGMWGGVGSNLVAGGPSQPGAPGDGVYVDDNLFFRWDLAEYNYTSGQSSINDTSGNSRPGNINNAIQNMWQSTNSGRFNWSTNNQQTYINNNQGQPSYSNGFTLEFWAKNETTNCNGLFDTAPNQVNTIRQYSPGGHVEWWSSDPTITMSMTTSWAHYVVTAQLQGNGRQLNTWKNGTSVATGSGSGPEGWNNYCVGVYNYADPWEGYLGMTACYNKVLSQSEIQQNYQALKHRYGL